MAFQSCLPEARVELGTKARARVHGGRTGGEKQCACEDQRQEVRPTPTHAHNSITRSPTRRVYALLLGPWGTNGPVLAPNLRYLLVPEPNRPIVPVTFARMRRDNHFVLTAVRVS